MKCKIKWPPTPDYLNVNMSFEYRGESLPVGLKGIAFLVIQCTQVLRSLHALLAICPMKLPGSLRMTLGDDNTDQDIDYILKYYTNSSKIKRNVTFVYPRKRRMPVCIVKKLWIIL